MASTVPKLDLGFQTPSKPSNQVAVPQVSLLGDSLVASSLGDSLVAVREQTNDSQLSDPAEEWDRMTSPEVHWYKLEKTQRSHDNTPRDTPLQTPRDTPRNSTVGNTPGEYHTAPSSPAALSSAVPPLPGNSKTPDRMNATEFQGLWQGSWKAEQVSPPKQQQAPNILELWEAEHSARSPLAAESSAKAVHPMLVKVRSDVAYMVVRVGDVLLYVETQVSDMLKPAKVFVIGKVTSVQERSSPYLSPIVAKVNGAYTSVHATGSASALHLRAKIVDGVLYVQGSVGTAKISIQARASNTWARVADQASSSYAMASRPIISTKDAMLCTAQPYVIKGRDGFLYVQAAIGNTLVRVKVSANDRIFAPIALALTRVHGCVSGYAAQIIANVVSLFDSVSAQFLHSLAPLRKKGKAMAAYTRTVVNNVVVGVKVRSATAQARLSVVYMTVKDGFIYIHGVVGDKIVSVKVSLSDLKCGLTTKATELSAGARARVVAATARIQDTGLSVAQFAKGKVDTLSSKVHVVVTDRSVQVTAVGAVGGAASMGVGGGAAGLATGSLIGAACGIPAAFFTFGLSIPMGAAAGGATGLCAGVVTGGAVGLVSGGATARSVHKHGDQIKGGAAGALNKASGYKDYMGQKAKGLTNSVAETTTMMKMRIVGGTGGSAPSDSD